MKWHVDTIDLVNETWSRFTVEGYDTKAEAEAHRQRLLRELAPLNPRPEHIRVTAYATAEDRLALIATVPGWSYERLVREVLVPAWRQGWTLNDAIAEAEARVGLAPLAIV